MITINEKNLAKRVKGIIVLNVYCGDAQLGDEWSLEYCTKLFWFANDPIELTIQPILGQV
jgi:hypothetical protein